MTDPSLQSLVDGARAYEQLYVPALFGQWTGPLIEAARIREGSKVLDVGCGTGALARAALDHVGPHGSVTGLDPNPGMLTVAREQAPRVDWQEGAAESLPFPDQHFDAVVSQFGLMFFQERVTALREMLRVLKPGGRLAVAVWDAVENIPGFRTQLKLIERLAGPAGAKASAAPFVLGDREALADLLQQAGATSVESATVPGQARFPSIRAMVEAELRGWLPVMGVDLKEDVIQEILRAAASELSGYTTPDGRFVFDVTAHIGTGKTTDSLESNKTPPSS